MREINRGGQVRDFQRGDRFFIRAICVCKLVYPLVAQGTKRKINGLIFTADKKRRKSGDCGRKLVMNFFRLVTIFIFVLTWKIARSG